MSRSEGKKIKQSLTVSTQYVEGLDLTLRSGISCQLVGPAGGTGTINLEISNDGENWFPSGETAVNIASGKALFQTTKKYWVARSRFVVTLSAGAGDYDITMLSKDI